MQCTCYIHTQHDSLIFLDYLKCIVQVATSHAVEDHRPGGVRIQANQLRDKVEVALD